MKYLLAMILSLLVNGETIPKRITIWVVDNMTQEPVEGAYVKVIGSEEIYLTNDSGKATFSVSDKQRDYKVYVTEVNYSKMKVPVKLLLENERNKEKNIIYLIKKPIFDESILTKIDENNYSAQELREFLMLSADNVFKFAPHNLHQYKGLVRKIGTFGDKYTYFQEALITIQDSSYVSIEHPYLENPPFMIRIDAIHQTQETAELDSIYIKKILKLVPKGGVEKPLNYFYKCYRSNYYRLIYDPFTVFASRDNFVDGCKFELLEIFEKEGDTFYKITFEGEPMLKNSYLIINKSDKAIVEFSRNQYLDDMLLNEVKVKLQKAYDGQYYPYFIELVEPRFVNSDEVAQYNITQLFLCDLSFDFKKFKASEVLPATGEIDESTFKVNPETWKSFFEAHPELVLPKDIYQNLSEKMPLEEQFR